MPVWDLNNPLVIPRIYRKIQNKEKLLDYLKEWVEGAAKEFKFEMGLAIRRLNGYIEKLDITSGPRNMIVLKNIRLLWSHFCLALVLEMFLLEKVNEEYSELLDEEYRRIRLSLDFLVSRESEEIKASPKASENFEIIKNHWELLSTYFFQYRDNDKTGKE